MMRRHIQSSRPPRHVGHRHCDSCFSRRCKAPVEISVSCALIPCSLMCGALFHMCKQEEHALLCPNEKVPCLNADFGCPLNMPRSRQAAHLQDCPASVVCCTMDWIRWPADEAYANTHPDVHAPVHTLHENLLKEEKEKEQLDLAMALNDQRQLYARLKMKTLYPEMTIKEEGEEEEEAVKKKPKKEDWATVRLGAVTQNAADEETSNHIQSDAPETAVTDLSDYSLEEEEEEDAGEVESAGAINLERYNRYERMFSMDRRACELAPKMVAKGREGMEWSQWMEMEKQSCIEKKERREALEREKGTGPKEDPSVSRGAQAKYTPEESTPTGMAPWQAGVLERMAKEATPQEYNMYLVHHGRMLLSFGQIDACTPRERDFVYGNIEPIPVQSLHSFKVPDSFREKHRSVHYYDASLRAESTWACVDTSDLGAGTESWWTDETESTLLGYAEREVMGHQISETCGQDGLYVDMGMQTYSFKTAPFQRDTTLADLTKDKPLKLRLQLQADSTSSRHNKACSAFTFLCGHYFQRREFPKHFRNVHTDIQTCVNGWFEQRCPLAYLGCTYSQRRLQPFRQPATVTYNQELSIFNLRPNLPATLEEAPNPPKAFKSQPVPKLSRRKSKGGGDGNSLSALPYEVLCHVARFLDSFSLSQLALVSHLMRDVCSSLLHERGMVTLFWEKKCYSKGVAKWKSKAVWQFSHLFSTVDSWRFIDDVPSMSEHLKTCPYYQTCVPPKPMALPSMSQVQGRKQKKDNQQRQSLVAQFMVNR
ncbi:F-box only protein 40 [Esox lucius]|uniref:F-box protein 40, tandem duplicate 1 n=1 Tax=Esox lucius TaxID=8010 RepID=A0A3P8ZLK4_ESOLU|nr:F-box only protein 40 [Esox lucius]